MEAKSDCSELPKWDDIDYETVHGAHITILNGDVDIVHWDGFEMGLHFDGEAF